MTRLTLPTTSQRWTLRSTTLRQPMFEGPNGLGLSRKAILSEIDKSLQRLETDYVDFY
jgi:aryl-alcohol dehydrogenase-like predicted oxidoreductase